MAYTSDDWKNRIKSRTDITRLVTHLTKPKDIDISNMNFSEINIKAVDNLIKILKDKKINGSTTSSGFIVGSTPAVCFQDAPLSGLIQNILYENERRKNDTTEKLRYCGTGLSFLKPFIFKKGGRPVIYDQTSKAKKSLPPSEYWKIVNFDLSKRSQYIDWSHEREWRLPNELIFDYRNVHVILYDPESYKYFIQNCPKSILESIGGITTLTIVAI